MRLRSILSGICVALCGLIALTSPANAGPLGPNKHCIVRLDQLVPGAPVPEPKKSDCYASFPDAIFAATDGRILLSRDQSFSEQLDDVERQQKAHARELAIAATFVTAIDYENINYGGATLTWTNNNTCTTVSQFAPSMPFPWDNLVSSTRGFSGCDWNLLWENTNYTGASLLCTPDCSSVGSMNDKTSSRQWLAVCNGTTGGWDGCRGTGCHVCAEKVAGYNCYFFNHPRCLSNSTCGGAYFTCNSACPAPTVADIC